MIVYLETIAPPLAPLTDEEQMALKRKLAADENRWVKTFIDRLAGVVGDLEH